MKRACSLSVILGCFAWALILFPAFAQAAKCSAVCTSTASCGLSCNAGGAGEPDWMTCGDWGTCAGITPPPTCTPNWVTTTATGGYAVFDYSYPRSCQFYGIVRTTQHDTNGCQPDQVSCDINFYASRSDLNCCTYYWCGGATCS